MTARSTSSDEDRPARKPYEPPRLEVYGDIRELTESVGMTGNADGGAHSMTKTG
jgi:hypothetical protein